MALLGDHSMVDAFKAGKDMHTESAMAALKVYRELDDEERQVGKTLNYSVIYGGGTPTLMRQRGIDYLEAREILDNYHERWPGIRMVQNSIQARLNERGYITTIYGRHLHPESDHKALNALCQGSAAELLRQSAILTDRWLKDASFDTHIVNLIHDEIMLDANKHELLVVAQNMPHLMRDPKIHEVVPIEVDLEVSFTDRKSTRLNSS